MPKRVRETAGVDTALVEIWEDLAHEDGSIRIKAAHRLLTNHIPNAEKDQTVVILKRLFRGLCSGRKAARLGFSIALTEVLTYLKENKDIISTKDVIGILESQTVPEANTTGQDERDHYFGRLFASDAVIKSGILFIESEFIQWQRLLDLVCSVSAKKPWLRQECGWILFNCVQQTLQKSKFDKFAMEILERLSQNQLIRSPEGLALWIAIQRAFPNAKLPKNVWKHDDPLAAKEAKTLAKVLMDAKTSNKDGEENGIQGSATWSIQLHFVWDVVLSELTRAGDNKKRIKFVDFWKNSVDDGLFAPSSSAERKHWGLMLLQKVFVSTSPDHISACFSRNAITCLMQSLKTNDRYLTRSAQKALHALQHRLQASREEIPIAVAGILIASDMTDFDAFTKTKTLETWFGWCSADGLVEVESLLKKFLYNPDTEDITEAAIRRKNIINIQFKLISSVTNQVTKEGNSISLESIALILESWMLAILKSSAAPIPSFSEATLSYIRERISLAFEQALRIGREGQILILKCISALKPRDSSQQTFPEADAAINEVTAKGWLRLAELQQEAYGTEAVSKNKKKDSAGHKKPAGIVSQDAKVEGTALLYGLTMFQVYNDDTDAISVLGDLLEFEETAEADSMVSEGPSTDGLVEIILSFAARPSKFLRRITLEIFATFTSQITHEGLQSLIEILETKETKAGQEQLFQADGADGEDETDEGGSGDDEDNSDVEELDSDVEMVSAGENSDSSEESESEDDANDSSDEEEGTQQVDPQSDELKALEASLAAALGTRKLTTDDLNADSSSSGSDSDMTDSEMMALDEKLADVFRARQANSNKKTEQKSAKENIINFKNRVLDMVEVYFRCEVYQNSNSPNPNSLRLLLPLLSLARTTNIKQLADRALEITRTFCTKCKGLQNVPALHVPKPVINGDKKSKSKSKSKSKTKSKNKAEAEDISIETDIPTDHFTSDDALTLLRTIHIEASVPNTSNAHKGACSQLSLLLVKVLLKAGVSVETVVSVYATTRTRMLLDPDCHVSERFFVDWGNWCGSVKGKLGVGREEDDDAE